MNRRTFLRALAALPVVGAAPALAKYRQQETVTVDVVGVLGWKPENIITPRDWSTGYLRKRLFLDGEDVTNEALLALPGETGFVVRRVLNPDWIPYRSFSKDPISGDAVANPHPPKYLRVTSCGLVEIRESPKSEPTVVDVLHGIAEQTDKIRAEWWVTV